MAYFIIKVAKVECLQIIKEVSFKCEFVPEPITIFKLTKGIIIEAIQKEKPIYDCDFIYDKNKNCWIEN